MDADVVPERVAAHNSGGGALRVAVVWEVRFLGEILAEILGRDPMVSVVGVWTDLAEAVAVSPASQADVVLARCEDSRGYRRRQARSRYRAGDAHCCICSQGNGGRHRCLGGGRA